MVLNQVAINPPGINQLYRQQCILHYQRVVHQRLCKVLVFLFFFLHYGFYHVQIGPIAHESMSILIGYFIYQIMYTITEMDHEYTGMVPSTLQ